MHKMYMFLLSIIVIIYVYLLRTYWFMSDNNVLDVPNVYDSCGVYVYHRPITANDETTLPSHCSPPLIKGKPGNPAVGLGLLGSCIVFTYPFVSRSPNHSTYCLFYRAIMIQSTDMCILPPKFCCIAVAPILMI